MWVCNLSKGDGPDAAASNGWAQVTSPDDELGEFERLWAKAHRGDAAAMARLADFYDGDDKKAWQRRAVDAGEVWTAWFLGETLAEEGQLARAAHYYRLAAEGDVPLAAETLSQVLLELGRLDEAERWARQALSGPRPQTGAMAHVLGHVMLRLGRLDEAEHWARQAVEEHGRPATMRLLADVLERQGATIEAAQWRRQADQARKHPTLHKVDPGELGAIVAVSVAVAAFVKAVGTKAGEDSYAGARAMVRWLFRRGRKVSQSWIPKEPLLVVEDPDPKFKLAIWLGTDTPDEQLRALEDLDIDAIVNDAKLRKARAIQIRWDEASKSWKPFEE